MAASLFRPVAHRLIVLYDGDCPFCRWSAAQLRLLDRHHRLELMPLQHIGRHAERTALVALAARHPLARSIHVLRPDGRVRQGGRAMLEILDVLPGGWLLRPWTLLPGAEALVDAAYRLVARRRGRLGRLLAYGDRTAPSRDLGGAHVT